MSGNNIKLEFIINKYKNYHKKQTKLKQEINEVIDGEIETFERFFEKIKPFYPFETINGIKSYLVYRFENSKNTSISPKVYYCEDGWIRYAVYDVELYKCYNPDIFIEENVPFARVPLSRMFETLELYDFIYYITKRLNTLEELYERKSEELYGKKSSMEDFRDLVNSLEKTTP